MSDLIQASVPSLSYHKHMQFICEALTICSKVCNPLTVADERAISACGKTVLQLLAHPDDDVRWQAYKVSLDLVKEAFSISHVTEPMSTVCQKALFLFNRAVLHQICCFGIYDENRKVSFSQKYVLLYFLREPRNSTVLVWNTLYKNDINILALMGAH